MVVSAHLYGCGVGTAYRVAATPAEEPASKSRARKRPKGAPTHVRSWALRPDLWQAKVIGVRFRAGMRVYNAVLGEFVKRGRAVKADPAWAVARELPHRDRDELKARSAAFRAVETAHGFDRGAAQSYASNLRKAWVREQMPAQEAQNLGARAFDAVRLWHVGKCGKPRFKSVKRGLHSLASKDGNGALRPRVDGSGRLVGLQWGAGLVISIARPAQTGRRGKEQQAELAEIEALIATGKVLSARIVRTLVKGVDTFRMQLVCDGPPARRHPVGDGRVAFDLGPSEIAVAVERTDGSWSGWVEPLAEQIRRDTARLRRSQRKLDRQHRAGSPHCFHADGTHKTGGCSWERSEAANKTSMHMAEWHRRLAKHRKSLHGALTNRMFGHGVDVACEKLDYRAWQKNFPRSVRDRAPGLLVEIIGRKAESAGGNRLYQFNPTTTALSQICLCGNRKKKSLNQRVHRCECGIEEHRDIFSAYLALHVHQAEDGSDRLDLHAARPGLVHRQDVDGSPRTSRTPSKRQGRRHPPSRRSLARIKARRAARRQSRSARTSVTSWPTAIST